MRENLNVTVIGESMSFPSEAISVMHLEEEVTLLLAVPNLGTWEPYLRKTEETIKKIRHRVTQARKIIGALNGVWWSKNTTRNRKNMIYNSMVKSVPIYGAETWSLYEDDRRRINATEMDALRR